MVRSGRRRSETKSVRCGRRCRQPTPGVEKCLIDRKAESSLEPEKIAPIPPVRCKALFGGGFDGRISHGGSILPVYYKEKIASSSVYIGQSARPVLPSRVR